MTEPRLFFLHIKRTGGTSLVRFIQRHYDWTDEILYQASTWKEMWSMDPAQVARARFVRGHFGINLRKLLGPSFQILTFLRDPVRRCLSDLNYAKHTKGHWPHQILQREGLTAHDAIHHPHIEAFFGNQQVANLGLEVPLEELWLNRPAVLGIARRHADFVNSDECLEHAKRTLDACCLVGINEFSNFSHLVLCRLNRWRPDLASHRARRMERDWLDASVSSSDMELLGERTTGDRALYDHGLSCLVTQLNQVFELNLTVPDLMAMSAEDRQELETRLGDQVEEVYRAGMAERPVRKEWDATMPLYGIGWHDVHSLERRPHRWSGPLARSELDIRLGSTGSHKMVCSLESLVSPELRAGLKVEVDGETVPHRLQPDGGKMVLSFILPPPSAHPGFVRVAFDCGPAFESAQENLQAGTLRRGLALAAYRLIPS